MKRVFCFLLSLSMCFVMFTQSVKSTGLTDTDVKSFAQNYQKIMEEFETHDIDFSFDYEKIPENEYEKSKVQEIFNKYGISGPNSYDKVIMIYSCYGLELLYTYIGETQPDPAAEYRARLSEEDFIIVRKNYNLLLKAFTDYKDSKREQEWEQNEDWEIRESVYY